MSTTLERVTTVSEPARRRGVLAWFVDRGVAAKVLAVSFVMGLFAVAAGVVFDGGLRRTTEDMTQLAMIQSTLSRDVAYVYQGTTEARLDAAQVAAAATAAQRQQWLQAIPTLDADMDAAAERITTLIGPDTPTPVAEWSDFLATWDEWRKVRDAELIPAAMADDREAYERIRLARAQPLVDEFSADLVEVEGAVSQYVEGVAAAAEGRSASARTMSWLALAGGTALSILLAVWVAAGLKRSVTRVRASLDAMAAGDLTVPADVDKRDEVGMMALSLTQAQTALRETLSVVVDTAGTVASASEELSAGSSQVSAGAEETSAQAGVVAAAAEQVSRNVQTVATGAEQMGASIREIASNAAEAASVAAQATAVAESAEAQVTRLGTSSQEIGDVVKVITTIAEQTNLLALNATIEAARAGEAGKGFAVVASEVKELAQETGRATEDIARRVEAIQGDTTGAVDAIARITEIVARINDLQTTIAGAVEEQTATTAEMARSVTEAAAGSTEIATNITGVADAAASSSEVTTQMNASVNELAHLSTELRTRVAAFTF